jgi:DNA repair exonuclease SbcCD ATPase subunit
MKPGDQLETLKQFVPGVDFALIDSANDNDFRLRTELNRAAKDLRAREAAIVLPETEPESPVDEDALLGKLEAASRINTEIETRRLKRQTAASESERLMEQALERRKKIAKLENELQSLIAEADELETRATDQSNHLASLPELPPLVDIAGLRLSCAAARQNNEAFEKFKTAKEAKAKLAEQASGVEAQSIKLTKLIDQRKRQKADAIAAAKLPIDGVGFGDGAVLLNGIPFDQASDAEQLRASIAITAAMNPKLRVIRVRDGSLLDENAMKLLAEFADAHELQVWIERVDSSGKVGFVLEDGRLVSQPAGERAAT